MPQVVIKKQYFKEGRNSRTGNENIKGLFAQGLCYQSECRTFEKRVTESEKGIDFFVRTPVPPTEGIFYDGRIFDEYAFADGLIKSALQRIVLIDNHVDETVLILLSKRAKDVSATVYTSQIAPQLQLDL